MTEQKFDLKFRECELCGLLVLGGKDELINHIKTDNDCKIAAKKKTEDFKKYFEKCKSNIDIVNENIKTIQKCQLSEDDLKPNMNLILIQDDEKGYKEDERSSNDS